MRVSRLLGEVQLMPMPKPGNNPQKAIPKKDRKKEEASKADATSAAEVKKEQAPKADAAPAAEAKKEEAPKKEEASKGEKK